MRDTRLISDLRFAAARTGTNGHLGFVSFRLGAFIIDGTIVRRALDGRIVLAFPEHVDRAGVAHPVVRPLDQAARDAITEQVVAELRRQKAIP